ncbi:MAG: PDZ domain-containing protein [Gemmatimonadota bacterium]
MKHRFLSAAIVALALVPTMASAQTHEGHAWTNDGGQVRVFSFNRARIGVSVAVKADTESDRFGATIQSVVPDGPAAVAGLKSGDIITRFNGTSLAGIKSESDDDDMVMSGPGAKLVELARGLDSGDTVKVEYRRDGSNRNATIVAKEIAPEMAMGMGPMSGTLRLTPGMDMPRFEGPGSFKYFGDGPGNMTLTGPGDMNVFFRRNFGLQLLELNPDLGEYFGTTEGVLVAETPSDSSMQLRGGDVILSIDGRKLTSEEQTRRIIETYEPGETVKMEIMRKHNRMSLEWKVQEPDHRRMRMTRPSGMLTPSRERMPLMRTPGEGHTQL